MKRWYMTLPKITKELKKDIITQEKFNKNYLSMLSSLRTGVDAQTLLFEQFVKDFSYSKFESKLIDDIANAKDFFDNLLFNIKRKIIEEVKKIFLGEKKELIKNYSVFSVMKEWLKLLKEDIYTQTFSNGTDKCLSLFRENLESEELFIARLAKLTTELDIEDWNVETYFQFENNLKMYKETAESYIESHERKEDYQEVLEENQYKISFFDKSGKLLVKKLTKSEKNPRSKLLYNLIEAQLEAMGQSLSEDEKRQVLLDILCSLF